MHIRRATASDASALTALTQYAGETYTDKHGAILDGLTITPQQIERDLCYLIEDDHGGTVGYYSLMPEAAAAPSAAHEAELDLMFVADHAQGGGLGELLFRHMVHLAREHGFARVRIVSHPPAEDFYLRMGATRVGTQPPHGRVSWERPVLELRL